MTEAAQVNVTDPGAVPAAPPAAPVTPPEGDVDANTTEQLAADKAAADEAKKKQDEEDAAEETRVKKKPWFQKRFDELTKQREEARREAAEHRAMLAQVINQRQVPAVPQETPPASEFRPTTAPPTREQFEFDEDKYLAARVEWTIEQREAKAAHDRRANEQQGSQQEFIRHYEGQRAATVAAGREKYPDFESVVYALPREVLNPEMALAIFETGTPADVAYHLGKNPDEARRISALPPLKKAIELGKLEGRLAAITPKTTQAPPVVKPVGGSEPARTDSAKIAKVDPEKWIKLRNEGKL
jgi:hypothetical protein